MPVKFHIRDGARFSVRAGERTSISVTADVSGLSGDEGRMLVNAYNHPQMVRKGGGHPTVPNMIATSVDGDVVGPDTVRFNIIFEEALNTVVTFTNRKEDTKEGLIQIGSSITTADTQRDKDGNVLTVSFTSDQGVRNTQGVTVRVAKAQAARRIERVERNPDLSLADKFTGTVNKSAIWGREARTFLCREIRFSSRDGGATWLGTYEFQYNEETWDAYVYFKDKDTGDPKVGISLENGIEVKRVLPETDYSKIGIRFPSR